MSVIILIGDALAELRKLPDKSVHMIVTSPPYWGLRNYNMDGQMGLERSLGEHIDAMVALFDECWRVLRDDGTLWLNYGDTYATAPNGKSAAETNASGKDNRFFVDKPFNTAGPIYDPDGGAKGNGPRGANRGNSRGVTAGRVVAAYGTEPGNPFAPTNGQKRRGGGNAPAGGIIKPKDLCGVPWRVAFALQDRGWFLRQDIVWSKPNPMPESIDDRCTKSHEYLFLLTKRPRYFFDAEAIAEPVAPATIVRLEQDVQGQLGSDKIPGRDRRPMKASGNLKRRPASDRGVLIDTAGRSSGAVAGNVPWEGSTRNKHSVWTVAAKSFGMEFCTSCQTLFYTAADDFKRLKTEPVLNDAGEKVALRRWCSCGCDTAWLSHFATFPTDLIEDCIKAGTSGKGVCAECGAPHRRVFETVKAIDKKAGTTAFRGQGSERDRKSGGANREGRDMAENASQRVFKGWEPGCKHDAGVIPATVLDPFGGAGTTGLVADRLQRNAILIELNPDYVAMARQRIASFRGGLLDRMEGAT